jgi:hypothetical protein
MENDTNVIVSASACWPALDFVLLNFLNTQKAWKAFRWLTDPNELFGQSDGTF